MVQLHLVQIFLITNYFFASFDLSIKYLDTAEQHSFFKLCCKLKTIFLMFESYYLRVVEVLKSEDF